MTAVKRTLKQRIVGRVEAHTDGRFFWWCEMHVNGTKDFLRLDSRNAEQFYEKREDALNELANAGRAFRGAFIELAGIKNVTKMEQTGGLKI